MSAGRDTHERNDPQRGAGDNALQLLTLAVSRALQALFWERLWPVLATILLGLGLFLAASWAGLWLLLPPFGRIIGLILFGFVFLASLVPTLKLRLPRTLDALRRLDRSPGLDHRPATAIADSLATRADDPVSEALWRTHLARAAEAARKLRVGWPRPYLAARDPFAIRALVLLMVVSGFFMAEGERTKRILVAFDWSGVIAPRVYRVDAWVTPPAYTGRPPVLLPGIRHDEPAPGETVAVPVPAESQLILRATGLRSLDLLMNGGLAEEVDDSPTVAGEGGIERKFRIGSDSSLSIRGLPAGSVTWGFRTVPDRVPTISLSREHQTIGRASLSLSYRVEDDYGVISAEARFNRTPSPAAEGAAAPRALVTSPDFTLTLPQARTRIGVGQTTRDITEHPWAGAAVILVLTARDEAGNEGRSEPRELQLPGRPFAKPLARALIEQRRNLAFDAHAREQVGRALEAFLIAPDRFTPDPTVYLGLRTAATRLKLARTDDDLRSVIDYMWEIAVLIEDGSMSDVERELRAAQDALRQALERGANEDEIRRLTDQLRQTLDRFMRALAEQLRRDGTTDARPLDRNSRIVRMQDLKNMLDRIENLARNGARDAARRLLDELQAMLDGLSRNRQARGDPNSGDQGGALGELGRMIQEQQRLRDRTFRQGREGRAERRNRTEQGQSDRERRAFGDLRQNQENLRQQLERLLEQLRRQRQGGGDDEEDGPGKEAGEALGRAEQAMRDSEGSLGEGDADSAIEGQGRALQNLRRGAQGLAQSMQQGGPGEGPGEPGGPQAEAAERTDPLGRPVRSREYGDDLTVKVPDEIDVQRARRVLEELRRRLGDTIRPRLELDYIERLLRDF